MLHGAGAQEFNYRFKSEKSTFAHRGKFEGIVPNLQRRYKDTSSDSAREWIETFMSEQPCPDCGGERLRKESRAVRIGEWSIVAFTALSVDRAADVADSMEFTARERVIT